VYGLPIIQVGNKSSNSGIYSVYQSENFSNNQKALLALWLLSQKDKEKDLTDIQKLALASLMLQIFNNLETSNLTGDNNLSSFLGNLVVYPTYYTSSGNGANLSVSGSVVNTSV
jgi:hypothetical protein